MGTLHGVDALPSDIPGDYPLDRSHLVLRDSEERGDCLSDAEFFERSTRKVAARLVDCGKWC